MTRTKSRRNCLKKSRYSTEARARIVGAYSSKCDVTLYPYVCSECGHWHLTKRVMPGVVPIQPGNSGLLGGA